MIIITYYFLVNLENLPHTICSKNNYTFYDKHRIFGKAQSATLVHKLQSKQHISNALTESSFTGNCPDRNSENNSYNQLKIVTITIGVEIRPINTCQGNIHMQGIITVTRTMKSWLISSASTLQQSIYTAITNYRNIQFNNIHMINILNVKQSKNDTGIGNFISVFCSKDTKVN